MYYIYLVLFLLIRHQTYFARFSELILCERPRIRSCLFVLCIRVAEITVHLHKTIVCTRDVTRVTSDACTQFQRHANLNIIRDFYFTFGWGGGGGNDN